MVSIQEWVMMACIRYISLDYCELMSILFTSGYCHLCRKCKDISVSDKLLLFSCINRIFIIYQVLLLSRCGNKYDLKSKIQVSDADMEGFSEQCRNLVSGIYKTSCKTGEGVPEMFRDIARQLADSNK